MTSPERFGSGSYSFAPPEPRGVSEVELASSGKSKLMARLREAHSRHFSRRTEQVYCSWVRRIHDQDLSEGWGHVLLSDALDRKYSNASTQSGWEWPFPQENRWKNFKTDEKGRHYVDESIMQRAFKQAIEKSGVGRRATCHALRRSFATPLLENRYGIRTERALLGYCEARNSMIFARVLSRGGGASRAGWTPCDGDLRRDSRKPYKTSAIGAIVGRMFEAQELSSRDSGFLFRRRT